MINPNLVLNENQKQFKQFLQFVGKAPNQQNAVFLIYNDKNSQPQKLFDCYQPINSPQREDMFFTITEIDSKKTLIFGLNQSYLNLKDDKQVLTSKHLILLYLLRKYPLAKFCFCFDKDTVCDFSFRSVKQSFERLAFVINYDKIKNCSQSFMILLYHSSDQTILDVAKTNLQKSIQQKDFYKENQKLVKNIYNSTVKQNNFIQINKNLQDEQMNLKKKEFQRMITKLCPIQFHQKQKSMPISDFFLNALDLKSANWKIFKKKQNLNKSQLDKTQSSTKSRKQNSQIHLLFSIWEEIFERTIKYIVRKLKNPKHSFSQFHIQTKYLLQNDCDKYKMPKTDLYVSTESKKVHSLKITKIFSKVVKNIIKIIKHKKNITQQDNRNLSWNKNLLDFIQIFYQSKVFDQHKKEKTLFDSFMIFNELYETLYPIRDIQNKQISFFSDIKMMLDDLNQEPIIKNNFLDNLYNTLIYQLQVDINRAKKGEWIPLDKLQFPLKMIEQLIEEEEFNQILSKQRILSTLNLFKTALFQQKMQKLSNSPHNKISQILDTLKNQNDLFEKKNIMIELVKTLFKHFEENRIKDVRLEFKNELLNVLNIQPKEMKVAVKFYQYEFQSIIRNNRKSCKILSQQEINFLGSFIQYLIKIGFVEKARQKAYIISQIDEDLSRRLLYICLLKTNTRRHFQFIKNDIPLQKRSSLNEQFRKTLKSIQNQFKKIKSKVEGQNNKIDDFLIDI